MSWKDYGLIFYVNNLEPWAVSHCYVPCAIELNTHIRVFAAFWDSNNNGRLGYVDVDKYTPDQILGYSSIPILPDSISPCFDCDGVTPLSIVNDGSVLRLYYAGWQRQQDPKMRYTLYTGLAISFDGGKTFRRYASHPVMEKRNPSESLRTGGFTTKIGGRWRSWLASSYKMEIINGKSTPAYNLETMESHDGIEWPSEQQTVFNYVPKEILGYGRSAIWYDNALYHGLFSVRSWDGKYRGIYYANSIDGIKWNDLTLNGMGFSPNQTCDQEDEVAFPSLIHQKDRILMFYNGNDFGRKGLRLAIWSLKNHR